MAFVAGQDGSAASKEKSGGIYGHTSEIPPQYDGSDVERDSSVNVRGITDQTHRTLKPRHLQLIGIGGTIGTGIIYTELTADLGSDTFQLFTCKSVVAC